MTFLRQITSLFIFIVSCFWGVELIVESFYLEKLLFMLGAYLLAYFIWPSRRLKHEARAKYRNRRRQSGERWDALDWLELLIELPMDIILYPFKALGRLFGSGSSGGPSDFDISG